MPRSVVSGPIPAQDLLFEEMLKRLIPPAWHPGMVADRKLAALKADALVQAGPFASMKYVAASAGSAYLPKLVGSYEKELHPWIELLAQKQFDTIIDLGAAEGFYAVGLARLFPESRVVAYESQASARKLLADLAAMNGVEDRIDIRGHWSVEDVSSWDLGTSLVWMDIEGTELEILPAMLSGSVEKATIVFEAHHSREMIARRILEPFSKSHRASMVSSTSRSWRDIRHLNPVTCWWIRKVCGSWTSEGRPCIQDWYRLEPRGSTVRGTAPATH